MPPIPPSQRRGCRPRQVQAAVPLRQQRHDKTVYCGVSETVFHDNRPAARPTLLVQQGGGEHKPSRRHAGALAGPPEYHRIFRQDCAAESWGCVPLALCTVSSNFIFFKFYRSMSHTGSKYPSAVPPYLQMNSKMVRSDENDTEACPAVFSATMLSCGLGTFTCGDLGCSLKCCRVDGTPECAIGFGVCTCLACCGTWSRWAAYVHNSFGVRGEFMK